ncbi:hypothetical protein QAD02_011086 [Eretmocerus hayati]|uniref:Uncharacterized protein n=1 Tax=Eretmocerus hayati TaxID=131215 RepID=A0ACC2P0I7_9HYME|nr:hypothetical protein QAD02_011086 [Eretmocerus hayati]
MSQRVFILPALTILLWVSGVISEGALIPDLVTNVENHQSLVIIDIESARSSKLTKDPQTGVIISKDYVLGTAPTYMISYPRFTVRIGSKTFDNDYKKYKAELVQLDTPPSNKSSDQEGLVNRLRLVLYKVKEPIQYGHNVKPISLVDNNDESILSQKTVFISWKTAVTHESDLSSSRKIRDIELDLLNNEECNRLVSESKKESGKGSIPLPQGYSCATKSDSVSSSIDDFDGGIIVKGGKLVGLFTSYIEIDSKIYYVYADLAYYRQSIKSIVGF